MRIIDGAHLPQDLSATSQRVAAEHDDVRIIVPSHDAAHINDICARLLAAREHMQDMPVARVIRAIDIAARRLLDPAEPARHDVLASLVAVSGFSEPMAAHLLDRAAADWLEPALDLLVRAELGDAAAVESFLSLPDGRRARAVAPPLGLHVFAGNVPGVGVTSIIRALLVRSAVLGKTAAAEPVLTPAFARLLHQADPFVGDCLAVTWWPGGDAALEAAALRSASLLVHYGSADSIAHLRARAPAHVRFIEHGPRLSFALVDAANGIPPDAPHHLARAVALFDQQGCVSPQIAWVIGTSDQARDFAAATATELDNVQHELPRGRIDAAEAAAIHAVRARAEFAGIASHDTRLWMPADLAWSVIVFDDPALEASCLNRTILIKFLPTLDHLIRIVQPFGHLLQTVGLAGFDPDSRTHAGTALAAAGVTRVTSIEDMPWPPPTWHHDGRGPLQELIRWVDLEP